MEELKCKVCGKLAKDDCNFNIGRMLCNRHNLQFLRHGEIISTNEVRHFINEEDKVCAICGDRDHKRYYTWSNGGELQGKVLCGKHYNQMINKGNITDETPSKHAEKKAWSQEELGNLESYYKDGLSEVEIANKLGRTVGSVNSMSGKLKLGNIYTRTNNPNYKAEYQNKEWLFQKIIVEGKTLKQISEEAGCSKRVLEKWANEKHKIRFIEQAFFTDKQKMLIISGSLGDGHVSKKLLMYIESHAENQRDYMFWKYEILKNLCLSEPVYYPSTVKTFSNGKDYLCQASYRMNTRKMYALKEISDMSKIEKIKYLNDFGLSTFFLDDGYCAAGRHWEICVASFTHEEKQEFLEKLSKYKIYGRIRKDDRYIGFDKESSQRITQMILKNIPNDLDIIKYKISVGQHE